MPHNSSFQRLRELGDRLADPEIAFRLFEFAPIASVVVDSKGIIQLVNNKAALMFGYAKDELYGQPIDMLVPAASRMNHRAAMDAYMEDPRERRMGHRTIIPLPREEGEAHVQVLSAMRKDGTIFNVFIDLYPLTTTSGVFVIAAIQRSE